MSAPSSSQAAGITLAPIKGSELIKKHAQEKAAGTPTTGAYVPPSKRKLDATEKPKVLTESELNSAKLFPSLGSASTPKAAALTPLKSSASANAFAVLDEDAASTATPTPANFRAMIQQRIKQDQLDQQLAEELANRELTVETMTTQELLNSGWAILPKDKTVLDRGSRWTDGPEDPEAAYFADGETFTTLGIPEDIYNSMDSQKILEFMCRPGRAGEDPWARSGAVEQDTTPSGTGRVPARLQALLNRRLERKAEQQAAAATVAAS